MRARKYYITLILLILGIGAGYSQENRTETCIYFRISKSFIDTTYSSNSETIQELVQFLSDIRQDSTISIVGVALGGAASPEGNDQFNRLLAQNRLASLEKIVRNELDIPDSLITYDDSYIPWDYLHSQVENSNLRYKDEVIAILEENALPVNALHSDKRADHRIEKLKRLDDGRVWQQMNALFFKEMRNAKAVFVTYKKDIPSAQKPLIAFDTAIAEPKGLYSTHIATTKEKKPFRMAIKANTLYYLLAIPNVGAEFYLGKNVSIAGNWQYSWWSNHNTDHFWRVNGGDLAFRYWIGKNAPKKPRAGHHLGLYGQMINYDFELGGRGYIADEWNWAFGVEYGYSLPIAKRLNLDFTLGLGYHWGEYKEYLPIDGHYVWQSTKNRQWIGPTKIEVSLVWNIGRGNYNEKKGGKR